MFQLNCTSSIISGTGGIIASVFWMIYILIKGVDGNDLEFLSAFTWFVFSIAVICTSFYEEDNIFNQ